MVQQIMLEAEVRTDCGKGPGHRLRVNGRIPAVVYGLGRPPVSVSVSAREIEHLMSAAGAHAIISLKLGDQTEDVMLQESQRHPITGRLLHADFFRIDMSKTIDVAVPIESVGTPVGIKDGGLLERLLREIEIRCLPLVKPSVIRVNVENIRIGHSLHVRDLPPMEGIEFLTPPDTALFTVLAPRKEEELVAAPAEGEIPEPEVIGKGKEKEEGEAEEEEKGEAKKEAKAEPKAEGKKEGKK